MAPWSEADLVACLARGQVRMVGAARPALPDEPEERFLARVIRLAQAHGFLVYHTRDSRKSAPGWPDVILAKPGHPLWCIELKTNTGKPSMAQLQWLSVLAQTEKPRAVILRPSDWDTIVAILTENPPRSSVVHGGEGEEDVNVERRKEILAACLENEKGCSMTQKTREDAQDAARYRWLRANGHCHTIVLTSASFLTRTIYQRGTDLDRIIDRALRQEAHDVAREHEEG